MGMPLELNTMIVTKGREERQEENLFTLVKEGYRLYPLDIPIEVKAEKDSDARATAEVKKIEWENGRTKILYQLISLHSSN